MKLKERDYWWAISQSPGIGVVRFEQLLHVFGTAQHVWESSLSEWHSAGIQGGWVERFNQFRTGFNWEKEQKKLGDAHTQWIWREDDRFPIALKHIDRSPLGLYVRGNVQEWKDLVLLAVVGTRNVTDYGRDVTRMLVQGVVSRGVAVVSGLMYGVDEVAHRACLEIGGYTVGVWAGGLDTFKGAQERLAQDVIKGSGLLVSEYPLGFVPATQTFPARNRIVAGMSSAVLVTEGSAASGTLITAGFAAEQGKTVLAVPGQIMSSQSVAPAQLIRSGATLVSSVDDIFLELGMGAQATLRMKEMVWESEIEKNIGEILVKAGLISTDELAKRMGKSMQDLLAILTMMELRGIVQKNQVGEWRLMFSFK